MGAHGGNVWNNSAVYPLWATLAAGMGLLAVRSVQWIGYDNDIQVTRSYRKADVADSDWLQAQGETYFNHPVRKACHAYKNVHIFPEDMFCKAVPQSD